MKCLKYAILIVASLLGNTSDCSRAIAVFSHILLAPPTVRTSIPLSFHNPMGPQLFCSN